MIKRKRTYPEILILIFKQGKNIGRCIEEGIKGDEPQILGVYSVATDTGIARMINRELVIAGII